MLHSALHLHLHSLLIRGRAYYKRNAGGVSRTWVAEDRSVFKEHLQFLNASIFAM